jgi:hypothetical protein
MVDNDKKEWQKKIPEFTTKFVHDYDLEVGIEIYGPKEFVKVYESYFHTLSAALLAIKAFPELTEVISLELRKKQADIQETIGNILKEKERHM